MPIKEDAFFHGSLFRRVVRKPGANQDRPDQLRGIELRKTVGMVRDIVSADKDQQLFADPGHLPVQTRYQARPTMPKNSASTTTDRAKRGPTKRRRFAGRLRLIIRT
mgnify:CR=1